MMKSVIWMIVHVTALVQYTAIVASETNTKPILSFVSLLPYPARIPSLQPSWDEGPTLFLAAELAVDHINNNADILSDYAVELIQGDSGCDLEDKAVVAFVEHVLYSGKQVVGIVGPGCSTSALTVSPLSGREDIALINVHIAGSPLLGDREKHPYSFGTLDSTQVFVDASLALIRQNNWARMAAFYDESRLYYYTTLQVFRHQIRDLPIYSLAAYAIYDTYIPLDVLDEEKIRVVFLLVGPDLLSKILCLAYHKKLLFPSHQWIIVSRTVEEITETNFFYDGQHYSCDAESIAQVVQKAIIIHYRLTPFDHNTTTDTGLRYEGFLTQYNERITEYNQSPNNSDILVQSFWATSYYDAVWALAWALNNSIAVLEEKNLSLLNYTYGHSNIGVEVREQLLQLDKEGVSGRIKFSNNTGYVSRAVDIYQVINNSMELVAYYDANGVTEVGVAEFINSSFEQRVIVVLRPPLAVAVTFLIVAVVVLVLIVISQVLTIVYRKSRSVRASSPTLSHLIYIGSYLLIVSTVLYIVSISFNIPRNAQCILFHILDTGSNLAITIIFSTVCAKTWRLYRIFVHYLDPGRMISNWALLTFISINVAVSVIVNIAWISTDRFGPVEDLLSTTDEEIVLVETCRLKEHYTFYLWFGSLFLHDVLLMVVSVILAIRCHSIPQKDFKTNTVIIHVYTLSLFLCVGFPTYFLLADSLVTVYFTLICVIFLSAAFLNFIFTFLSPFLPVFKSKWRNFHKH